MTTTTDPGRAEPRVVPDYAPAPIKDPYELRPQDVTEPPRTFFGILRRIGPGIILSASIVGSGELIATTTLGAEVGYIALWIILLSCVIKPAVQSEFGRYVIATGQTGGEGLNQVPGPKILGLNWVVAAWALMTLLTLFQIGAMFVGVSVVMHLVVPFLSETVWVLILLAISLALLLGGGYARIEKLATVKVALFTMLTFLCALLMMRQPQNFSWDRISEGFRLKFPQNGLITAIAVFGITGVGASELFMYPYWCVEKGYARFAGKWQDDEAWRGRARGWVRVMNVDILASMVIYCVATVAFYLLGAGILHTMGLVPSANDMIPVLSKMYTETLGAWAVWLFYAGAIATLYGTIFAATAGNSRVLADVARLAGLFPRDDYAARVRYRNGIVCFLLVVPVILLFCVKSPVNMVKAGGVAQAAMLPILSVGALYLRHRRTPREVGSGPIGTVGLWIACLTIITAVCYSLGIQLLGWVRAHS
jgi:Mn2+/Fe2+ NRAMP family transporter